MAAALRDRLSVPVRAVHVDHGLQASSSAWAAHCTAVCDALDVPLTVIPVRCDLDAGHSYEEAARAARYQAFERLLCGGEALLLAHHREDQAETVLLRLLRGAGVRGAAAMPPMRLLGDGYLARPLLDVARDDIALYAATHRLVWIDDPSNSDPRFDRNYLRHAVLPLLAERWPGYAATLARSAEQAQEASELADALADLDLAACGDAGGLCVGPLRALPDARRRNVVRRWLMQVHGVRPPPRAKLVSGLAALLDAAPDRMPKLGWDDHEVRRYRDRLIVRSVADAADPEPIEWDLRSPLSLPGGMLRVESVVGSGLRQDLRERRVEVRFRVGGERCRPAGRSQSQSLKKLLQEAGVPPWERAALPLIYVDGALAAVAGLWVCEGFQAAPGEPGLRLIRVVKQGSV